MPSEDSLPSKGVVDATQIATTVANIGSQAAVIIAKIGDDKKRAQFQNNLSLLSADENNALNKALINASSNTERLRIITDTLTNLESKRIDLLTQSGSASEAKIRTNTYIAAGVFVAVALGLILFVTKKK